MKKNILLIIILFIISTTVSAQNIEYDTITDKYGRKYLIDKKDIDTTTFGNSRMLKEMKLGYKKPDDFEEIHKGGECFDEYLKLKQTFMCLHNELHSRDKQLIVFIMIPDIFTRKFKKEMEELFPKKSFDLVDKQHFSQMKAILKSFYGKEMEQHWREKITTYPKEEALNKFNADNAYLFSITLSPEDYYEKKFKYVDLLFLQKKGRGYVYFCCFYTDKSKLELNKYWSKIEKVFHYED